MTRQALSRSELEGLHSVLRRAAERAEQRNREMPDPAAEDHAQRLAQAVAEINDELAGRG
jgi:hypothetical protein